MSARRAWPLALVVLAAGLMLAPVSALIPSALSAPPNASAAGTSASPATPFVASTQAPATETVTISGNSVNVGPTGAGPSPSAQDHSSASPATPSSVGFAGSQSGTGALVGNGSSASGAVPTTSASEHSPGPSSASLTGGLPHTASPFPYMVTVVAQVNASASRIIPYPLAETEKITPGSSDAQVNYVVLNLSGFGAAEFGIGTTLWGDDIIPFTGITVDGLNWYNYSFSPVTLHGGTNYYLSVESVSAGIGWSYVDKAHASVDTNALRNYYCDSSYASQQTGGLPSDCPWYYQRNDNKYPQVFTLGYARVDPPSGLVATVTGPYSVQLSWTNPSAPLVNDTIYYYVGATCTGTPHAISTGGATTSYAVTGLTAGTEYCFVVTAWTNGGESPDSNSATATTFNAPPAAPTSLTATTKSDSEIDLSWTAPSGTIVNYTVYQYTGATCSGTPTPYSVGTGTSYAVTGLTADTEYCFVVTAWTNGGESPDSSSATATTFAGLTAPTIAVSPISIDAGQSATLSTTTSLSGELGHTHVYGSSMAAVATPTSGVRSAAT